MDRKQILAKVHRLLDLYKSGELGGEVMPEDANPDLPKTSNENYLYFTLPMALNYQRNSYKLWEAAKLSYEDKTVRDVFNPLKVIKMKDEELRERLLKYKIALQPNKHVEIWKTISAVIVDKFDGDLRKLFVENNQDVGKIKEYMLSNKKSFPYLSGSKIMNYWLYVMEQYTDVSFKNRGEISVAPDTHVIQASVKLGVIDEVEVVRSDIREYLSLKWQYLLKDENICPIDVHTPMWLWSRGGFKVGV